MLGKDPLVARGSPAGYSISKEGRREGSGKKGISGIGLALG